ncbi:MAG: adenosyl-hopene transferase HpnH [Rhodovibrionaceae bacterium]|nr:adenosyl-hopene transferase HpnH [Rhodovibrionaceae bacterium]
MAIPVGQQARIASYIMRQRLAGRRRYPLVLMLEPLFQCNLACPGCGKIDYPKEILQRRLSVEECVAAAEECGAPVVSIPGGEPLIHKEIDQIVAELIKRKRYIYLCTNALLLEKKMHLFQPSKYLVFSVHLDGLGDEHDKAVDQSGVFDKAVAAIRSALDRGFRVTINCTLFNNAEPERVAEFLDFASEIGVEGVTISPGYAYERAPDQEHFLTRAETKNLFRDVFRLGKDRNWRFCQSSLFLDFLAGNQRYTCVPWSNPTRNIFGWQRPCYLLNEGYASSFRELMEETDWESYGTGNYEKCANCMVHCGYEGAAAEDAIRNPLKALLVSLRGVRTEGEMAPEIPLDRQRPAEYRSPVPVASRDEAPKQPSAKPEPALAPAASEAEGDGRKALGN